MSYPESPAPIPAEADDALFVAVLQVCETSFFTYVESCEPDRFAELVDRLSPPVEKAEPVAQPVEKPSQRRGRRSGKAAQAPPPAPADPPKAPAWLQGSIGFTGSVFVGTVDVMLPERLARQMVAWLLGLSLEVELNEVELLEHQVFDGIGEFANMICGAWLTDLRGSQAFDLGTPEVTRLPSDWNPIAGLGDKDDHGCLLCVNDLPMRIRIRPSTD